MSRLRKSADEVKTLSQRMVEARTVDTRATELRKAGSELSEQVGHLRPLVESLVVLRSVPELMQRVAPLAAPVSLAEEISKTRRDAAKAGARMIEDAVINLTSLRSKLANWRTTLEVQMSSAWQAYVNARFEPMDKGLLDALERCGYQAQVRVLRESGGVISCARQELPRSRGALETFNSAITAYKKRLADLDAPAAVHKFLVDAVAGGAPLAALSPEVRSWLESRHLESNFLVKVRQTSILR